MTNNSSMRKYRANSCQLQKNYKKINKLVIKS